MTYHGPPRAIVIAMLRITTEETDQSIQLLLEGKLSGPWVAELERAFHDSKSISVGRPIILDLRGLTRADAAGRELLATLEAEGAALQNWSPLASALLSRTMLVAMIVGAALPVAVRFHSALHVFRNYDSQHIERPLQLGPKVVRNA